MKQALTFIILIVVVVAGFMLLRSPADAPAQQQENADQPQNTTDEIDSDINGTKTFEASASSATWTGKKTLIKDYYDNGTVSIKSGSATFANGVLTGGTVTFDMTTIAATSTGRGDGMDRLSGHLKSDDFFAVETYPESTFVITSAARESGNTYLVTGDLTVKGKTAPVTFPTDITTEGDMLVANGMVTIDRTVYDVRFGSTKFFQDLGDNVIADEFTLEFKAVMK